MIGNLKAFLFKSNAPTHTPAPILTNSTNTQSLVALPSGPPLVGHVTPRSIALNGGARPQAMGIIQIGGPGSANKALGFDADDFRQAAPLSLKNKATNLVSKTSLTKILAAVEDYSKRANSLSKQEKRETLKEIARDIKGWQADHDPLGTGLTSAKAQAMVKLDKAVQEALEETSIKSML